MTNAILQCGIPAMSEVDSTKKLLDYWKRGPGGMISDELREEWETAKAFLA